MRARHAMTAEMTTNNDEKRSQRMLICQLGTCFPMCGQGAWLCVIMKCCSLLLHR